MLGCRQRRVAGGVLRTRAGGLPLLHVKIGLADILLQELRVGGGVQGKQGVGLTQQNINAWEPPRGT